MIESYIKKLKDMSSTLKNLKAYINRPDLEMEDRIAIKTLPLYLELIKNNSNDILKKINN